MRWPRWTTGWYIALSITNWVAAAAAIAGFWIAVALGSWLVAIAVLVALALVWTGIVLVVEKSE